MRISLISFATVFLATSPAVAADTNLMIVGNVSYLAALQDGKAIELPTGSINLGDKFKFSAKFDVANSELTTLFDADPSVNIYYLPDAKIVSSIGSYKTIFQPLFNFNASVQLWNDRVVVGPTDAQSFEFFNYDVGSRHPVPFDLGAGLVSEMFSIQAFDFSAAARTNDLISQLVDFDMFGSRSINYSLYNATNKMFVMASITPVEIKFSSAPEPSTWLMLIAGFGLCGSLLRRRNSAALYV